MSLRGADLTISVWSPSACGQVWTRTAGAVSIRGRVECVGKQSRGGKSGSWKSVLSTPCPCPRSIFITSPLGYCFKGFCTPSVLLSTPSIPPKGGLTTLLSSLKRKEEGWGGVFHFQRVVRNEWARVWRQNLGHEMMTRYPWFWSVTVMITDRLVLPEGPGGFLRMAAGLEPELRFPPLLFRLCLQHASQTWNLRRATANARCSL